MFKYDLEPHVLMCTDFFQLFAVSTIFDPYLRNFKENRDAFGTLSNTKNGPFKKMSSAVNYFRETSILGV